MTDPTTVAAARDISHAAARLAFAMLRFEEGAALPALGATPRGLPRVGIDSYRFVPALQQILFADVPEFLLQLPSPALLIPTTTRGVVTLLLLDELTGERRVAAQQAFDGQQASLRGAAQRLSLVDDSPIVVQLYEEEFVASLAVLRRQRERYLVAMSSRLDPCAHNSQAKARLMLLRSDGLLSSNDFCSADPSSKLQ